MHQRNVNSQVDSLANAAAYHAVMKLITRIWCNPRPQNDSLIKRLGRSFSRATARIRTALASRRTRQAVRDLEARMLKDIGLPEDVERNEIEKRLNDLRARGRYY